MSGTRWIFVTGATGLIGRNVLARLLSADTRLRAFALVRHPDAWSRTARELGGDGRVIPVTGDLRADGLCLTPNVRSAICRHVTAIVHLAADTTFSNPLDRARAVNTDGTRRVLELAHECTSPAHVAYVSTAFVAGRRTGVIAEDIASVDSGWVNAYEQSKCEAERLVAAHAPSWVILRSSTVVCDGRGGRVTQVNAVHRALRLYHRGLVAMMPSAVGSSVDVVTTEYVADAVARLALRDDAQRRVVHLCAGANALPFEELLDITYERWATDADWRRRNIERPALTDLPTYALFERTVEQIADPSIRRLTRALSHFVPQLALPKRFETTNADTLLGYHAPAVREFWRPMLDSLLADRTAGTSSSRAERAA